MNDKTPPSPFAIPNVRRFIAFRVCFNARFYYPVFAVLFLDFGLTLEQFALLNAAWAATIVLLEVPSGALADLIGRRNLLVVAGVLMIAEIALLCLAPRGGGQLLFAIFLVNRVLSGMAEAAASGADEALAYDALKRDGRPEDWGRVLERQIRYQSMGYVIAMSVGAAVYDPDLLNRLMGSLGLALRFAPETTLRFPLFLTLAMAIGALVQTLGMEDIALDETPGENRGRRTRLHDPSDLPDDMACRALDSANTHGAVHHPGRPAVRPRDPGGDHIEQPIPARHPLPGSLLRPDRFGLGPDGDGDPQDCRKNGCPLHAHVQFLHCRRGWPPWA